MGQPLHEGQTGERPPPQVVIEAVVGGSHAARRAALGACPQEELWGCARACSGTSSALVTWVANAAAEGEHSVARATL